MSLYIYVCVCEDIYYSHSEAQKKEGIEKWRGRQPKATDTAAGPSLVPQIGVGDLRFSQVLQNETSHHQDLPS
jgi:hypothetical protein